MRCLILISSLLLALPALGASHIESVDGELSDDPAAPTSLVLEPGSNPVEGSVAIPSGLDYLHITVPDGHALVGIELSAFGGSGVSFLGIQAGPVWTAGEFFSIDPALLLGWAHFGPGDVGTNLLPAISMGDDAQGFLPPLSAGDYTVLFQETGVVEVSYGFDLTVASVPEPSVLGAMGLSLLALAVRPRRSSSTAVGR